MIHSVQLLQSVTDILMFVGNQTVLVTFTSIMKKL